MTSQEIREMFQENVYARTNLEAEIAAEHQRFALLQAEHERTLNAMRSAYREVCGNVSDLVQAHSDVLFPARTA